jgi:catechol 2,3-dioxygenase-like lactoylglutathione lyase family enzyme
MIRTYGLTHISLAVADLERSLRFYQRVFGVEELYRDDGQIQVQTPGSKDVIAFDATAAGAGGTGGIAHFGFRLVDAADIDEAVREVERAGGTLLRRGEFCPGCPDGYEIEIWYE